jgi:hypothetical protein
LKYSVVVVAVSVAGIVVGVLTGCSGEKPVPQASSSAATWTPQGEGRSVANYFKVGDCFQNPVNGAKSVTLVDCATPHAGEVYAIFMLPDGPFPGNAVGSEFKKKCGEAARAIASPATANDPSLRTDIRFPDENSWALGDRSVTCIATSNPPRTGSIRNTQ